MARKTEIENDFVEYAEEAETAEVSDGYDEPGEQPTDFDADAEQAQDEAQAWLKGNFYRKELPAHGETSRYSLVITRAGGSTVLTDMVWLESAEGESWKHVSPAVSRVGEGYTSAEMLEAGYSKPRAILYNRLTDEIKFVV